MISITLTACVVITLVVHNCSLFNLLLIISFIYFVQASPVSCISMIMYSCNLIYDVHRHFDKQSVVIVPTVVAHCPPSTVV